MVPKSIPLVPDEIDGEVAMISFNRNLEPKSISLVPGETVGEVAGL